MSGSAQSFSDHDIPIQTDDINENAESGSRYSTSESSRSLSPAQEASHSRGRPKKRKFEDDSVSLHDRGKRLKGSYNDEYRKLFNETLKDIFTNDDKTQSLSLQSQIGVTSWSPGEKDLFFSSIARRSRHDVQSVAKDIGSKSESEVKVLIGEFENAVREEQLWESAPKKLLKTYDLDAALEVSEQCCASLDLAAETLSKLQYEDEQRLQRDEHGDLSLLTSKIAKWADGRLRTGELGEEEIAKSLPAAQLLNLKTFLTLSKQFFMNSSVAENNWRSYAERRKSPSMMYTAFLDFHNLTLSITKRLIQSSLFFSMSRLKAMDASGAYISKRHVKRADVVAALEVLGMELNTKKTWARTARKCKVRVYEGVRYRRTFGKRYSYDEVEEILGSDQLGARDRYRGRSASNDKNLTLRSPSRQTVSLESSSTGESGDPDSSSSPSAEDSDFNPVGSDEDLPINNSDKTARKQELYANALDQRASREEERRLWKLLGDDLAMEMESGDIPLPKAPVSERKDTDELTDWTTKVNFVGQWEKYEAPVPANSFMANRKIGRGSDIAAGLTESDTESDELEEVLSTNGRQSSFESHGNDCDSMQGAALRKAPERERESESKARDEESRNEDSSIMKHNRGRPRSRADIDGGQEEESFPKHFVIEDGEDNENSSTDD